MKSEPDAWSWDQQTKVAFDRWTGVRSFAAARHLRDMHIGDLAFFYHSNIGKEIVGIVEVVREAYPDPTDETGKFVCVDVRAKKALKRPVTLAEIKADPALQHLLLVRQARLSVMPIDKVAWQYILKLSAQKH